MRDKLGPSGSWAREKTTGLGRWRFILAAAFFCTLYVLSNSSSGSWPRPHVPERVKEQRRQALARCKYASTPAGPSDTFYSRTESDRYVLGTNPVLLTNAKIWTGGRNGTEFILGDMLLHKGLIKAVGYIPPELLESVGPVETIDVNESWVTPGLVDLHSHLGVYSSPKLRGARDGNSLKSPILPWLRSIDGLNTHDIYDLIVSGGVTTAQILPGSANNIGGQAYVMKLRPTAERSATSMLIEPPFTLNGSQYEHASTPRWRHMKHACGENPSGVYGQTRMDSVWLFRKAYDTARQIKESQDIFCAKAETGKWDELGDATFPEDFQWESLVDVLRGKVKLSIHCYEAVDLDAIVRLTNEFKFPVASFHHAAETYLVPDLLKQTWGGAPTVALFATNARKKREAYRASEFATRILSEHGIPVVLKSDHPVVNSRELLYEAQLAHYYGLDAALALAAVTSTPANALGLGHRIGTIREGYDADIVVWDSHPLALGATPSQVYIDGIPQFSKPIVSQKPDSFQEAPRTPKFDKEAAEAVEYEGLPPLEPRKKTRDAVLTNVRGLYTVNDGQVVAEFDADLLTTEAGDEPELMTVMVRDGQIICTQPGEACFSEFGTSSQDTVIDLAGGSLAPGFTSFGSDLGLVEIRLEPSTADGFVNDPLAKNTPSILGGPDAVVRAVDGLQFGGRNTLLAYRAGVTQAIVSPRSGGFLSGLSTAFSTSAAHALDDDAVVQNEVALHIAISHDMKTSVSSMVTALRNLLYQSDESAWVRVREGEIPLIIRVENADIMATLIHLKAEFEADSGKQIRLTFVGAAEAHLVANEIGNAGVNVILIPARPFPAGWDQRRILPGPPLTYDTSLTKLLAFNVTAALGVEHEYTARNARFDIGWAALEANGRINKTKALALATINLEEALGLAPAFLAQRDLVAYASGDVFDIRSKIIGVVSSRRGVVDLF